MSESQEKPGTSQPETNLHDVDGVPVYARKDPQGRPTKVDAIDQDERKIRDIADRLQRRGFGVMRERNPRAGKVFYTLKATWAGEGEPPEDPFYGA
ncbi:MAG: hypothetical protein LC745_04805 [Planctomycetia bacterium]|nr:hypothetical protein [Planctomycetia bacterium]